MRKKISLNEDWLFHLGEIGKPRVTVKKALAIGGPTSPLPAESTERLPISPNGHNFLKLIAQGNEQNGLKELAATDISPELEGNWKKVTVPHDWKYDLDFTNDPDLLMSGSKKDDVGYYRKVFTLSSVENHIRTKLNFDGVMRMAEVWLNGIFIGRNISGYTSFSFDVTELLHYGDNIPNVLLVRADTTTGAEGWWYEGAGIYRDVFLEQYPETHLNFDDAYIYTTSLKGDKAKLAITFSVSNEGLKDVNVHPNCKIGKDEITFKSSKIEAGETSYFHSEMTVDNPKLWTPENPNLYSALFSDGQDSISKGFGIHTFKYDDQGFFLNGNKYQLHGVCEHQYFTGVGVALTQDIVDFKVMKMKAMGVNAWRSAHHFASPQLLDACDRLGIILINENRILESSPWRLSDLNKMVKKARMHASVGFWSLANEEIVGNTDFAAPIIMKLANTVRKVDKEHLIISAELLSPDGNVNENYLKAADVLGVNYPEAGVMDGGALAIRKKYPTLPIMSTENASYFSTRGAYKDNEKNAWCNNLGSMYSMVIPGKRKPGDPGVGGTAHPEEVIEFYNKHPEFGGVFLWTAFDYCGEPSPYKWPAISSQFGIVDTCGFAKDYYYYYKANWTSKSMVHLMPNWNKQDLNIDDAGKTEVRAFSNANEAELFLNGTSLGRKTIKGCRVDWAVKYTSGNLSVKAYKEGKVVAEDQQITANSVSKVTAEPIFEGNSITIYQVSISDSSGNFVPDANIDLNLFAESGKIIGNGNGNPGDNSTPTINKVTTFNGLAVVLVSTGTNLKVEIN